MTPDLIDLPSWHHPFWALPLFVLGCCWGSFFNVCIYRIPLGISIITPRSRCASCGIALKPWQNLPLLGWLSKGGWCGCGLTRIDFRYFLVELGTGLMFVALWQTCSPPFFVVFAVFLSGLLIASLIDIDYYIIPDRFSLGGILLGIFLSTLFPPLHHVDSWFQGLLSAVLGTVVGGGILWLISQLGRWAFKKEAMGLGDVKLLAAMGAFLGWPAIFYILAVSSLIGSVIGLALLRFGPLATGHRLPFGPFLSLAAASWIFGGSNLAVWYLNSLSR